MTVFLRILKLLATALTPAIAAVLVHIGTKKWKPFSRLNYWVRQVIIGVIFSLLAVMSFLFGIKYTGEPYADPTRTYDALNLTYGTANAAPLIAGLGFGWPAGLTAGFLSGLFRVFCHPFGVDDILRAPDAVGVFLAGVIGALLRRFLFENKKPKWGYAFLAGLLVETLHCTLILVVIGFIKNDVNYSYGLVAQCDIAIIACVSVATALALFLIAIIEEEPIKINVRDKKLASKIQRWMLVGLGTTFAFVLAFTLMGTYNKNKRDLINEFYYNAQDVETQLVLESKQQKDFESVKDFETYAIRPICSTKRIKINGFCLIANDESVLKSVYLDADRFVEKGVKFYVDNDKSKTVQYLPHNSIFTASVTGFEGTYYYYIEEKDIVITTTKEGSTTETPKKYYIITGLPTEEIRVNNFLQVRVSVYLEILAFISIYTIIYTFIRVFVVKNIIKINNSLNQITQGNLNTRVNVRSNEEFSSLSDDINKTVDTLKGFINEAEKRFDKDLQTAKEIQHSALPYIFPTSPEYDLYAIMKTAKQVGGDFYDFFPVTDHHIFFSIADVSGKGIPAAMFMMKSKTLIKSLLQTNELTLDQIVTTVNEELCDQNDAFMFVTAWFGILNLKDGKLHYVNAGHNPPLVKLCDKPFEYLKMKKNFVLGAMDNVNYQMETIDFKPGDEIILYTDGVTEATSKSKELYGESRLLDFVNSTPHQTSKELIDNIIVEVDKFQKGAEQADDITTLVVKFNSIKK